MALTALGALSDAELARLVRKTDFDLLGWLPRSGAMLPAAGADSAVFRLWLSRPHTDDMMAMLDDLGIEPPAVIEAPEWVDGWSYLRDGNVFVIGWDLAADDGCWICGGRHAGPCPALHGP